jgi:hypothetical protein
MIWEGRQAIMVGKWQVGSFLPRVAVLINDSPFSCEFALRYDSSDALTLVTGALRPSCFDLISAFVLGLTKKSVKRSTRQISSTS